MLVLRPVREFQPGDTVQVDMASLSGKNQVALYAGGVRSGEIALAVLGPLNDGAMVVTALRSDVRRCRSSGCSLVGYLERGQVVDVRDFAGRWYRVAVDGEAAGYVLAEHLQLPVVSQIGFLGTIAEKTASYYAGNLKGHTAGSAPLFSGYDVELEGDVLDFEFYTPFSAGPALGTICDAMRGIADFVRQTMAETPAQLFPAYSAGIYFNAPNTPPTDDVMIAGLTGDDGVFCQAPN
jgi:hypothetical protein